MEKYHIEENTVQETLVIPLFGRKVCSDHYPDLFHDAEAEKLCSMLDYDFEGKAKKMENVAGLFGALEVAQRQYDLAQEVRMYLEEHPAAAVVNLGCGLDDTCRKCDNGTCKSYNIDLPEVIGIRNQILPAGEREENLAFDLNDPAWMEKIDDTDGAVFFASGVLYYLKTEDVRTLIQRMAVRFPGAVLAFDSCNRRGARMMTKTWLKEAGITEVDAYFSLEDPEELSTWSEELEEVSSRSYMRGYRDIYDQVGSFHKLMIRFCDSLVKMRIVKLSFK